MTLFLCPVRPADPRPLLMDEANIRASVTHSAVPLCEWSRKNGATQDDSWVIEAVTSALLEANGNADHAIKVMEIEHHWIADRNLRWHFDVVVKNLPAFFGHRVMAWVLRTGMRFPGKKGDLILLLEQGYQHNARIATIFPMQAMAMVETEHGVKAFINAESVIENKTDRYAGPRVLVKLLAAPRPDPDDLEAACLKT